MGASSVACVICDFAACSAAGEIVTACATATVVSEEKVSARQRTRAIVIHLQTFCAKLMGFPVRVSDFGSGARRVVRGQCARGPSMGEDGTNPRLPKQPLE